MIMSASAAWTGLPDQLKIALDYYGQMAMMVRSEWDRSRQVDHEGPLSWERWIEIESLRRYVCRILPRGPLYYMVLMILQDYVLCVHSYELDNDCL